MVNLYYLTTFPEIIEAYFKYSIPSRAVANKLVYPKLINLRDFAEDKHRTTDDTPYGGGPGMVMKIEPFLSAFHSLELSSGSAVVHLTPKGQLLSQPLLQELSNYNDLVFLCGHYEGIDERIGLYANFAVSIGDYIVGGGEISSLVVTDGIIRLIKEVVGNEASVEEDSFSNGLLDHPQYTRPRIFDNIPVPDVLLSGHHQEILNHRRKEVLKWTLLLRPDLLKKAELTLKDKKWLKEIANNIHCDLWELLNE